LLLCDPEDLKTCTYASQSRHQNRALCRISSSAYSFSCLKLCCGWLPSMAFFHLWLLASSAGTRSKLLLKFMKLGGPDTEDLSSQYWRVRPQHLCHRSISLQPGLRSPFL
jgi:hypothetical protein